MEPTLPIRESVLRVAGAEATIHAGGPDAPGGEAVVLLHGGWGGAALHWSPIWGRLAARHRVVAPELPGFGRGTAPGPRTIPEHAAWVRALLDALGLERAWVVGHAFGGAIAWQLAATARDRVRGLVLLNGGPPPEQPWMLRKFFAMGIARGFVRHALRNGLFGPMAIARAFDDPARAPAGLAEALAQPDPPGLRVVTDAILSGGESRGVPRVPVLMLWGEADRLPGTDPGAMDRLVEVDNAPGFETIPGAGHLPQVEAPEAVLGRIEPFLAARGAT